MIRLSYDLILAIGFKTGGAGLFGEVLVAQVSSTAARD
jgi:hypothetical protein